MKKVLFALAAVVALAACSKEQTLVTPQPDAIGFGQPFIENSTRAVANEFNSIDSFQVWGNVTGNAGSIFLYNGENVTRNGAEDGDPFTCEQKTEYWIPSATYNFMAISGANGVTPTTGFPTKISYTATGSNDLLLSEYVTVTTDNKSNPTGVNTNKCVAFTFKHLLSKVYFNFTNASTSDKCSYEISNIQISGAKKTSTYDIAAEKWATATGDAPAFSFGDAGTLAMGASATSAAACLFIPGEQDLYVSFTQQFKYNGTAVNEPETVTASLTPTFAANGCYVINVELKAGSAITFTVDANNGLNGWDSTPNISIP